MPTVGLINGRNHNMVDSTTYDYNQQQEQQEQQEEQQQEPEKIKGSARTKHRYIPKIHQPKVCKSIVCVQQRLKVFKEYAHLTYREKFEVCNRCTKCNVFYPKSMQWCPCCKTRMRQRSKKFSPWKLKNPRKEKFEGY